MLSRCPASAQYVPANVRRRGVFSQFCALFAEKSQEEGEDAARLFASTVASVLLLTLGLATILAIIFMRPIVTWMNPPRIACVNHSICRITSIYLLCMVITALITGVLNSKQHFAAGAFAPILFNICTIGGLVISVGLLGVDSITGGYALAVAVAVAGLAQVLFLWLIAALKFRLCWWCPCFD